MPEYDPGLASIPPSHQAEFATEALAIAASNGTVLRWTNLLALRLDNGLYVQLADVGNDMVAGFGCCRRLFPVISGPSWPARF